MRRSVIVTLRSTTLRLDSDIVEESKYVLMNYGPVRAGLTTLQTTSDPQLTELLNYLERKIENLQSKSYTDSGIYNTATQTRLALRCISTTERVGIDER